ncbi:VOC family protein [Haliangium sp.]|uniref:VOC family protein n=1 Tax=Haliangium sp. TaxID=2663208 RepID=UPI003D0CB80E
MSEALKYTYGKVVWRELMTPDPAASKKFYGEIFGWDYDDVDMGPMIYTLIKGGERGRGGIMKMDAGEHPPHWMSYVSVPDVDAAAKAAEDAGGTIGVPPTDIPQVGRFSVIGDPGGAWITAFKNSSGDVESSERPGLGEFCWETLSASEPDAVKEFYSKVFGWNLITGPDGSDNVFAAEAEAVADLQKADDTPNGWWLTYVVVADLGAANAKVEALGGKIVVPRIDVPTIGAFSVIVDPHGAHLGLFEAPQG